MRIIGVDTPETVKPDTPVRCYGPQASAFTKHLLPAGTVIRAAHEPGGDVDRYGRQLWDVWLPDGRFLESVLAAAGAARAYPFRRRSSTPMSSPGWRRRLAPERRGLWGTSLRRKLVRGQCFGRLTSTDAGAAADERTDVQRIRPTS